MKTKLTIRVEEETIKRAKQYSKKRGESISRLFEKFINALTDIKSKKSKSEAQTLVATKLKGILKGLDVKEDDYRKHLEEKYL
ncbi:MAG: antitoxin [Nitrospiraceae bacterium]|nr:antitoxin [Nitrospiraceae bacterium]